MNVERDEKGNAPSWLVWTALWIVYIVWGSTYLAIRVTVETLPPLLAMGVRFLIAGLIVYFILLIKRGRVGVRVTPSQLVSCAVVGTLLFLFGNGMVAVSELELPSSLAALVIASVPLWVIIMRALSGDKVVLGTLMGIAVGFTGVAILVMPGNRPMGIPTWAVLLILFASTAWALGSFLSTRMSLPKDLFVSSAYQMMAGGISLVIGGLVRGEASGFNASDWSGASLWGFLYLITIGSLVGFTAYAWLLQNAPISKVSTYAYVNPVVAILLGWLILSEEVTATTLIGATVIVISVAFIVRKESKPNRAPEVAAAVGMSERVTVTQEG
jgi:drug/metabolite transporter (DMT)-like permease